MTYLQERPYPILPSNQPISLQHLGPLSKSEKAITDYVASLLGWEIAELLAPREIYAFAEGVASGDRQTFVNSGYGKPSWAKCSPLKGHVCTPPTKAEHDLYNALERQESLRMPQVEQRILSRFGHSGLALPASWQYRLVAREYQEKVPIHIEYTKRGQWWRRPSPNQCTKVHRWCCGGKPQRRKVRRSRLAGPGNVALGR